MSPLRRGRWLAAAALCLPASLLAQGFGLSEIGSCAAGRGFTATGTPCADASTIFWNPAAAAELAAKGSISIGGSAIVINGRFNQDSTGRHYDSAVTPAFVPDFFGSVRVGKAAVGLGIYVPYGLTSQWRDDFPGRFSALRASLQSVYFQPNVAFNVGDNWSIGGGPVFGHSSVDLTQSLELSSQTLQPGVTFGMLGVASGTEFGRAKLHGTASATGYNLGVHGHYGPWSLGARYLSSMDFKYDHASVQFYQTATGLSLPAGNPVAPTSIVSIDQLLSPQFTSTVINPVQFPNGGALVAQSGASEITHPWQAQGGVGYTGFLNSTVSFDLARIGWSDFNNLPVNFAGPASTQSRVLIEDYHDSWAYRFGAEHKFATGLLHSTTGRLGYSFAETPAPDETVTPLLPDQNRRNFSAGLEFPIAKAFMFDASYIHVNTPSRRGRIAERTSAAQTAAQLNTGTYDLKADVISFTLNATF